jgi:hypothetical protein
MASAEDATAQQAVDIQVSTPPQRAPIEGSILSSDRLPTPQELQIWLLDALHAAQNFAKQHPEVQNVDKLCRRIKRDLAFVQRFLPAADIEPSSPTASPLQQQPTSSPDAPQQPPMAASDGDQAQPHASKPEPEAESHAPGEMSLVRMQGIVNNLRGFNGELQAAMEAPQVSTCSVLQHLLTQGESWLRRVGMPPVLQQHTLFCCRPPHELAGADHGMRCCAPEAL